MQGIGGVRYAVSPNIDVGLKYRILQRAEPAFAPTVTQCATDSVPVAQPHGEPDLQLLARLRRRRRHRRPPAASAASGDADVPGWLGDPGDGHVPGTAASASAAATGARARLLSGRTAKKYRLGPSPGPVFFCPECVKPLSSAS